MFPATKRMACIYMATEYAVWLGHREIIIRVGERNASIDSLLLRFKCRSAAFVTAWNPRHRTGYYADARGGDGGARF
jgi:hypothetical protein